MGKRGNGEGTIYQDEKTGRWIGQATIQGKRRSLYGKTRKDVQDKLRALLANADKGILPPAQQLTVAQFMKRWLADVVKPAKRPKTYVSYEQNYRCYIGPALGRRKLAQLQPADLRRMYAAMQSGELSKNGEPLAPHSIRRCHAVLHTALEQALADNLVYRNVAHGLKGLPSVEEGAEEATILSPEQVTRLLAQAQSGHYHTLLTVAVYTGLRQGELFGLRWEDVDLEAGTLSVRQNLSIRKQMGQPKSRAGVRSMTLPKVCVAALREHKVLQTEIRLMSEEWNNVGLIFTTLQPGAAKGGRKTLPGSPLTQSVVARALKALLARAGLPQIKFHELRHTACSLMALQGVPATVAMKRMGHSDIRLTLQRYTHVLEQQDVDAAARLDALLA